ncbi:MAG: murein biosynthesis integral membrane protein MurJ [Candidatus Bipolaricaulaceae bacterium]
MSGYLREVLRGAAGTGVSRVCGLLREAAVAHVFGASSAYDAFLIAYFVPNLLRRVLGEGGLAAAFLPVYAELRERGEGRALAGSTLLVLLVGLPPLCLAGSLLARWYVPILAGGFSPAKLSLAVQLAEWLFPSLALISLGALAGGLLNAHGRFFLPALAPAAVNVGMVVGALVLARTVKPPVGGLVAGVLGGGAAMVAIQLPAVRRLVGGIGPKRPPHPGLAAVGRRLLPVVGGLAVAEVNCLVDNRLASYLAAGSVAVLQYAMRLFQFPVGVLAVSVATAALPRLARHAARGEDREVTASLSHGFALVAALMLPATGGLLVLGPPTVRALFQHGAFTAADAARTTAALGAYLAGLWAYGLIYLFSRTFYALGRPGLPVITAAAAVAVNVGLDLWWVGPWQTFGLALATGVAGWADALLQGAVLWRRRPGWIRWRPVAAALAAAGGMTGLMWTLDRWALGGAAAWTRLGVGLPTGLAAYLALGWATGLWRQLRAAG